MALAQHTWAYVVSRLPNVLRWHLREDRIRRRWLWFERANELNDAEFKLRHKMDKATFLELAAEAQAIIGPFSNRVTANRGPFTRPLSNDPLHTVEILAITLQ